MKATMIALSLFLGLAVSGTTLIPSSQAHAAKTSWTNDNQGGGAG